MPYLLNDLRKQIEQNSAVLFVGTGVSMATTNGNSMASWRGLLEHGIQRCSEVVTELPSGWLERIKTELDTGDLDDLLSVAQKVTAKLKYQGEGEYRLWLQETVGSLRVENPDLIQSLAELKMPIATTNYDSLIENVTFLSPILWTDHSQSQAWLRGNPGILHIHGHWSTPNSVVLVQPGGSK